MQLIAGLSAVSALIATVSANTAASLDAACDTASAHASIVNNCNYPVYLWSVVKGTGCPANEAFILKPGGSYKENLQKPLADSPDTGISIKMSKSATCGGADIAQLEYFLNQQGAYAANYLDMSYIDCPGGDCPSRKEGFHLVAGSQTGDQKASSDNSICPVISCSDAASCAKWSYLLPDDPQTRSCKLNANLSLNLCGSSAPSSSNNPSSAPTSKSAPSSSPVPSPSSSSKSGSYAAKAQAQVAAVTPVVDSNGSVLKNIKTEVVYVTATSTVNARRHLYGHARRHARFHA